MAALTSCVHAKLDSASTMAKNLFSFPFSLGNVTPHLKDS